jgi:hypothetical protein
MDVSRRSLIIAAGVASLQSATISPLDAAKTTPGLPAKSEFPVVKAETCLNNARWHPISIGATQAVQEYLEYKASGGGRDPDFGGELQKRAKTEFAKLIHARPSELSFVPSTTVGENLVAAALDLPRSGGNVVTDALHFEGSLYQYGELAKQGLDLRIVRPREWRIELADLDKVIDSKTKLVALSLVSMINWFQHDLKAVCDLATPAAPWFTRMLFKRSARFPWTCGLAVSISWLVPATNGSWVTWASDFFMCARNSSIGSGAASTDSGNWPTCNITSFRTTRPERPSWTGHRRPAPVATLKSAPYRTRH